MKALCCYCCQTCRQLPVGSKWPGAYQSASDNFPDCFAREVLVDCPWKRGTLLVPEDGWCSRDWCRPSPPPAFLWGEAVATSLLLQAPCEFPGWLKGLETGPPSPPYGSVLGIGGQDRQVTASRCGISGLSGLQARMR